MEIAPRISVDEKICFGKPVISGTRVPVDLIIGKLAGGMTYEDFEEQRMKRFMSLRKEMKQ
ncbi:TPA: DUF433 domain-containing protein [Candidatus Poribacteria bacterium]|nr:DUF433 domain-containing protein [Candidatus Poribacteria bacterium]